MRWKSLRMWGGVEKEVGMGRQQTVLDKPDRTIQETTDLPQRRINPRQ